MADFLRQCNSGDLKTDPKTFQETWCVRCQQVKCSLAGYAKDDLMAIRNQTWRQRYFGAEQADLRIPEFAQIAQMDFPNLIQKALKLEISERRGDWSVPEVNIPVLDGLGVVQAASTEASNQVEEAVKKLLGHREPPPTQEDPPSEGETFPVEDDDDDLYMAIKSPSPTDTGSVPPTHPKVQPPFIPHRGNVPQEEIMLGGAPRPKTSQPPEPEVDPWAAPDKPSIRVVKPGTRIQFGSDGSGKVVDNE